MAETFEALDKWTRYAIEQIKDTYGDDVSVSQKKKPLLKFGRTSNADADVKTTIAVLQGTEVNETFATGNTIDYLSSSDNGDTVAVTVEGHTLLAGDLSFSSQTVTLTGTTPVALTTPLARVNRLFNVATGSFASPATALVGNDFTADGILVPQMPIALQDSSEALANGAVFAAGPGQIVALQLTCDKAATVVGGWAGWLEDL